eukprot:PhF_6_TR2162/c0_g1_i3/m.3521
MSANATHATKKEFSFMYYGGIERRCNESLENDTWCRHGQRPLGIILYPGYASHALLSREVTFPEGLVVSDTSRLFAKVSDSTAYTTLCRTASVLISKCACIQVPASYSNSDTICLLNERLLQTPKPYLEKSLSHSVYYEILLTLNLNLAVRTQPAVYDFLLH